MGWRGSPSEWRWEHRPYRALGGSLDPRGRRMRRGSSRLRPATGRHHVRLLSLAPQGRGHASRSLAGRHDRRSAGVSARRLAGLHRRPGREPLRRRHPRRPSVLRRGRPIRQDPCPPGPGSGRGDVRGRHGRLRRRTSGCAGLRQRAGQRLLGRRRVRPGDQAPAVGRPARVWARCRPMGRAGRALDRTAPAPERPGGARHPSEAPVRPAGRPRGSEGHRLPAPPRVGGL